MGWFEPFSHYRVSFNVVYVADPFFSIVPGIALVMLLVLRSFSKKRKFWWRLGLGYCLLYLSYCLVNKVIINREVKQLLARQEIKYDRYFTTPAPLQSWLWFVVAEVDSGYHIGYRSVFDKTEDLPLTYIPKNENLLDGLENDHDLQQLKRFSQGYFAVEHHSDTLVFNDLRFGQITGWHNPSAPFVFHYYVNHPEENLLVMQRGRFAN